MVRLGCLFVDSRTRYVTIMGGDETDQWRGPSVLDGLRDLAFIWLTTMAGFVGGYFVGEAVVWLVGLC